jgi:sulfatase modifying factor 1
MAHMTRLQAIQGRGDCLHREVVAVLTAILLAGCGGSDEAANPVTAPPPPPPPPVVAAPAVPQAPATRGAAVPSPRRPAPQHDSTDANDADNLFLVGESRPNFVVAKSPLPVGHERYQVVRPASSLAANLFRVVPPDRSGSLRPIDPQVPLPAGFTALPEYGAAPDGRPLRIRCDKDTAVMAYILPGAFTQGIDGADPQAGPAHPVYVDGFYMDVHETTLGQYREFREAEAAKRPAPALNDQASAAHPAAGITWRDANYYVQWAGKTLPTEAEWEKAARGERNFTYPWGEERPVWHQPRQPGQIDPVATYRTDCNPHGLCDLAGNVREWCSDWYGDAYYATVRTPDGSPARNPTGPAKASQPNARVLKGPGTAGWELWRRSGASMRDSLPDVGFRGVLRLPAPPATSPTGT